MNINVREFYSLTKRQKENFYQFLSNTDKNEPASVNMWDSEWENKPNTLPYILEHSDRFFESRGNFIVLYNNDEIIACGGVYKSQFNNEIAVAGVRTYINSDYRHNSILREYLLPFHKRWARLNNCKVVLLSFNEYNKNIIEIFKRRRLGEKLDRINTRNHEHLFFNGLNELEFPVNIQNTKQYVIYENLDNNYTYDWNEIKWEE